VGKPASSAQACRGQQKRGVRQRLAARS
jgi:hypothetical protein